MSKFVAKYPYSPLVLPFMFLLYLMITTYWITATHLHFADHLFLIPTHSQLQCLMFIHYENLSMQYTDIFSAQKPKIFSGKNLIFFLFLLKT